MDEHTWLTAQEPTPLLLCPEVQARNRKQRLFACACCRRLWDCLIDSRSQQAVDMSERFADGLASATQLSAAHDAAWDVVAKITWQNEEAVSSYAARAAYDCSGAHAPTAALVVARGTTSAPVRAGSWSTAPEDQAALLREIFGNPWRPVTLEQDVLTRRGGAVPSMARGIYEERYFTDLPLLADVLFDAGCRDEEILAHCRSTSKHVRGCWVLDLILGRN